jgi:uncharacterized phage infection (PIP) family protein YhgE
MKVMRRILGVLVMFAGVLGLVLSLAGMVGVWVAKPTVALYAGTTTIDSVDALSAMLGTTAAAIKDTEPVLQKVDTMLAETLPSTLKAATDALYTARDAARVLESTIQQLNDFRTLLSDTPLLGSLLPPPGEGYNPEKPMAASLGELASDLEGLPDTFIGISADLSTTDDKLAAVQENLVTMSESVGLISSSLSEYEKMITQSKSSMDDLQSLLSNIQNNLPAILNAAAIILSLLLLWLLAAQVVILSQGWELYQGTADRMEGTTE